jgi:hypothetical protein
MLAAMPTPPVLRIGAALGGLALAASLSFAFAAGGDKDEKTTVTIWRAPANAIQQQYYGYGYGYPQYGYPQYGGTTYGSPGDAAFISHRRSVDVTADGELRFPGVSTLIDASTVQFRSITDPKGTSVVEQRYAYDLGSPEKLMRRYIGKQVTITTGKGEIKGTLRALDRESIVVETGAGASRSVEIIRRGDNLLDVKLTASDGALATVPTLVWKVQSKKPGKQSIEVSYRTDGLRWNADYTAILDDKNTVDLSAWATIHNDTGIDFKDTELVLVTGVLENHQPVPQYAGYVPPRAPSVPPVSFKVPRDVTIAAGGTVQVELVPARSGVSSRRVVLYETIADMSMQYQSYMYTECYSYGQPANTGGNGELALEVDAPTKGSVLPEGRVRVFKRKGDGLELLGEDNLKVNAATGHARLRLGTDEAIKGERRQLECKYNDQARSLREKFEIKLENKSKDPVEVVLREYMYRWVNWKIDAEDLAGTKAANQTQEYRIKLAGNSKKTFTYAVVYTW